MFATLKAMTKIALVAHDIRSTHNIGALLRTAEGLGVTHVYMSGYTPYPASNDDTRLPHISRKLDVQIHKTALGAEKTVNWSHTSEITDLIQQLKNDGYEIIALEQDEKSQPLPEYKPTQKVAILLGREVEGLEPEIIKLCDKTVEIPMFGTKESFNVVEAATMAMYHCRFLAKKNK
jgi:tRNA G18 (ribose-2'-O)-methylase SpoU